ncbi:carboxymuconolactone decarboxylase family protein [Hirschia maritima]|uniref:carboxymuconolactone decarboxylase family protein n=1 Tax=Hirschia maritima TaxID=1121961 RepID=UPI0003631A83|nr:carboxymuconolactone decarboxylase family protein [Hirschia maritima]
MSRIPTPPTIADTPAASQDILNAVNAQLGTVPNLFRITATSPAALEGYVGLNTALSKGNLNPATRERIALAIAQINGCDYCLAAHTYLGTNVAKLTSAEIEANRRGTSTDVKANAAVRFAVELAKERGHVSELAVKNVKDAGFTDGEIVEIIAHVALNTLTNYVNSALDTEVDFPAVSALAE